ncbi:MAG: hypothetical protein R3A47_05565 [Polyangiales bacterium]
MLNTLLRLRGVSPYIFVLFLASIAGCLNTPTGRVDKVYSNGTISGWACDRDHPTSSVQIRVWIGKLEGNPDYTFQANEQSEAAVNAACGGGTAHRFSYEVPGGIDFDQPVHVLAVDLDGNKPQSPLPQSGRSPVPSPDDQLAYPKRSSIKGIQPDDLPTADVKTFGATGGIAVNMVWSEWEPEVVPGPDCPRDYYLYDGRCYKVDPDVDARVREAANAGIPITAIVFGTPEWARIDECTMDDDFYKLFCVPKQEKHRRCRPLRGNACSSIQRAERSGSCYRLRYPKRFNAIYGSMLAVVTASPATFIIDRRVRQHLQSIVRSRDR